MTKSFAREDSGDGTVFRLLFERESSADLGRDVAMMICWGDESSILRWGMWTARGK